jgi:hypothetical protein
MTQGKFILQNAATQEFSADLLIRSLPFEQVQRLSLRKDSLIQVRC